MSSLFLPCVEVQPTHQPARSSVIWMHGLGADGHDFESLLPVLEWPSDLSTRFIFPHAPEQAVTINNGYVMRAWYDILEANLGRKVDQQGIRDSMIKIDALIEREKQRGVPSDRIILAGFSQGGVMAVETGLRHAEPLAGILALSTYVGLPDSLPDEVHTANARTPILQIHGRQDPIIDMSLARASHDLLESLGNPCEWDEFDMPHTVSLDTVNRLRKWMLARLS